MCHRGWTRRDIQGLASLTMFRGAPPFIPLKGRASCFTLQTLITETCESVWILGVASLNWVLGVAYWIPIVLSGFQRSWRLWSRCKPPWKLIWPYNTECQMLRETADQNAHTAANKKCSHVFGEVNLLLLSIIVWKKVLTLLLSPWDWRHETPSDLRCFFGSHSHSVVSRVYKISLIGLQRHK